MGAVPSPLMELLNAVQAHPLILAGGSALVLYTTLRRFSGWRRSWTPCRHGVAGGQTRTLCQRCAGEQKLAQEKASRECEQNERRGKIESEASKLRDKERLRLAKTLIPSIDELRRLTSQQFEDQVAMMFERLGYAVKQTPYVKDHGRDAILWKNGGKFVLECKKYGANSVSGRRDLQILHSNMMTDRAVSGFFVTAGSFSRDAVEFARNHSIELVDRAQLLRLMFESKPGSADDTYITMCKQCGAIVLHHLRASRLERCSSGHDVRPGLDVSTVLTTAGAAPVACQCGAPMRLVNSKNRRFWGCTRYPACRHTRQFRTQPQL